MESLVFALILLLSALPMEQGNASVDFDTQIIPLLTKAGCNTGACHGAAVGRGGFRLSLYGGDPLFDYHSMVFELEGRRVNLAQPDASLVMLKPTESLEHGGGYRLDEEGDGAQLLLRWIREGALRSQTRTLQRFQVTPKSAVLDKLNSQEQLKATATFSDGSKIDVTKWTVFSAEDPDAVEIDAETATATLRRRGRHVVIARYLNRVVPLELIVPLTDSRFDTTKTPKHNFIDDEVLQLLSTLRIPVSAQIDDASFLRRATLDLTGRLPNLEAVQLFLQDSAATKRADLIEELMESDEFNDYWTFQFAKLLRIRSQPSETQGALTYHRWLKQQIEQSVPYDQIARQLLTSSGDTHEVGPANFYRTVGGPRDLAEFASEVFMGSRLRCANCHNHPLDRWTQDDYHGLAAVFAKLQRGRVIQATRSGEVTHPRTGKPAVPRIPGDRFLADSTDGRTELANWLTNRDNKYFAKATVNRLWKAMMGRGLVEPSDDFRETNPATHPVLLERLAADFIAHGYDLRHTLKRIAQSAAYARSARPISANAFDDRYYSHGLTRELEAEILADAISDVLQLHDRYGDQPIGTRAVTLFDSKITSPSLDILGRCSRENSCETADATVGGLTRMLHVFNGSLLNHRISQPQSRLAKRIADGVPAEQIIDEFYLCALGRQPTGQEQKFWKSQTSKTEPGPQTRELLEDFVWSLLTCREFVTNH